MCEMKNDKESVEDVHESNEKCSVMNESCLSPTVITYQLYMMNRWWCFFTVLLLYLFYAYRTRLVSHVQNHSTFKNIYTYECFTDDMNSDVTTFHGHRRGRIDDAYHLSWMLSTLDFFCLFVRSFTWIEKFQWTQQPMPMCAMNVSSSGCHGVFI